jgi:hypothetical protein
LDLTENATFFRQDIRETQQGVVLRLKLKVIGSNNCQPMNNVRVNIWHCTKDGLYSGYSQTNNQGQAGLTYLRGYQYTNANGEVDFITVFPGWYTGRICHIHFQVYVNSSYSAISQLSFPVTTKNALYAENASLYPKGADPLTFANDNIFSNGYQLQLATLVKNETLGGYDSFLEITVQGSGISSVSNSEIETAKNFVLGQNFPNPYVDHTSISIDVKTPSKMSLALWNLNGQKVHDVFVDKHFDVGNHTIELTDTLYQISRGSFVYEVTAKNVNGVFKNSKMMTRLG